VKRPALLLFVCAALLLGENAWADRVDKLIKILQTDSSYKVRLQASLGLGKLKDKRAVPALTKSLSDDNSTVRGVSAAALGQIGDKKALPALQSMVQRESDSFAKTQAEKAVKALSGGGAAVGGPVKVPAGTRFFVTVGKLTNKSPKGGDRLAKVLGDALVKEFSSVSGVITDWGGRAPSASELSKSKVQGFVLDGSILSVTAKKTGDNIEVSCDIKVSLSTFPGNSMKAFYSGGAGTEVSASGFRPQDEDGIYKDIIEGAAQGAKQSIMQCYLSMQ
jgi:hypothetical protein